MQQTESKKETFSLNTEDACSCNETFITGAKREEVCARYDLISPYAMERLARTMHYGARRYGERNWEKGIPLSVHVNHAIRHLFALLEGDPHDTEDHAAHAMANCMMFMHTEELLSRSEIPVEIDDIPTRTF